MGKLTKAPSAREHGSPVGRANECAIRRTQCARINWLIDEQLSGVWAGGRTNALQSEEAAERINEMSGECIGGWADKHTNGPARGRAGWPMGEHVVGQGGGRRSQRAVAKADGARAGGLAVGLVKILHIGFFAFSLWR